MAGLLTLRFKADHLLRNLNWSSAWAKIGLALNGSAWRFDPWKDAILTTGELSLAR